MVRLILITLIASAFFSSTYILNELMSNSGGHWFWSASLRYLFTLIILTVVIALQNGGKRIPFPEGLYQNLVKGNNKPMELIEDFAGEAPGYYFYAFADAKGDILLQSDNAPSILEFLPLPKGAGMSEQMRLNGSLLESTRSFDFGLRSIVLRGSKVYVRVNIFISH